MTHAHDGMRRTVDRLGRRLIPAVVLASMAVAPLAAEDDTAVSEGIERTREAMRLWVETRRMISAEERDWRLGRELLESQILATRNEIEARRRDIEEARAGITENDRKRLELVEENDALKASTEGLEAIIVELEGRVRTLVPRMPRPLAGQDVVKGLVAALGDGESETDSSLADRYLVVAGILTALDRFNREITESRETIVMPDGSEAEYTTVYIGLGQAYFLDREETVAGVGIPGPEGWTWTVREDAVAPVVELVKVVRNETPAKYVELPVVID